MTEGSRCAAVLDNSPVVQHRKAVAEHEECPDIRPSHAMQGLFQLIGAACRQLLESSADGPALHASVAAISSTVAGSSGLYRTPIRPLGKACLQQLKALPRQLGRHAREPGDVAAGSREVRTRPCATGSPLNATTIGMV